LKVFSNKISARSWPLFAAVMMLVATLAVTIVGITYEHKGQSMYRTANDQLAMLTAAVVTALEDGSYDEIPVLFDEWGRYLQNTVRLELTTGKGFELARFERPGPSQHLLTLERSLSYGYRGQAKLKHTVDVSSLQQQLEQTVAAVFAAYLIVLLFGAYLVNSVRQRERETAKLAELSNELNNRNNELSAEHALLQAVINSIPDPVYFKSPDGSYKGANRAFCEFHGVAQKTLTGKKDSDLFDDSASHQRANRDSNIIENRATEQAQEQHEDTEGNIKVIDSLRTPYYDEQQKLLGMIGIQRDITRLREYQDNLKSMAYHDPLTGLPNRRYLVDRMHSDMAAARRNGSQLAVCAIDLDGFKPINDSYGHDTGDKVIIAFANRLQGLLREEDTVARWGGDEFTVLLKDAGSPNKRLQLIERIMEALSSPFKMEDISVQLSASIGITLYPDDDHDADTLLRHADQAMYQSKQNGKSTYTFFDPEQNRAVHAQATLSSRLAEGIDNNELCVYYDPQINMLNGHVHGFEALVRWQHPQQGLLSPGQFLPMVENHPLGIDLDWWVLEQAAQQVSAWKQTASPISFVGVNIAAMTLQQSDFVARLETLLSRYPLAKGRLRLEILETSALADIGQVTETINRCSKADVSFAIDDFGTGYSSLTYLRRLPAQMLKIDRSFVADMLEDENDRKIVEGILRMGEAFDRQVLAEGVESIAHGVALLRLGCIYGQGFGIARPMPAEEALTWAESYRLPSEWANMTPIRPRTQRAVEGI